MVSRKICLLSAGLLCWIYLATPPAFAEPITLYQSVEQALAYSPRLQAQSYNHEAFEYELKQARARYRPSLDLLLGYGVEQHSDRVTRQPGALPADTDVDSRGDATLRLTQQIYDWGETSQQVTIQKALLDAADFDLQGATQEIILDALKAHLDVYRQRELVALAEKDLAVHRDIHQALLQSAQAGAGDIADVTQTRVRMARAQSILISSKNDLTLAVSNYERVVGVKPGELAFAEVPNSMPASLEESLAQLELKNPELLSFDAETKAAEARAALARSIYKPKINLELSSRYHDQLEGDPSWQNTNDAMVVLRWDLFDGGQNREAAKAALSRKHQSRSKRTAKLIELREDNAAAWATYLSLQGQKSVYRDAVASSKKTFDAYLNQFSVSLRSLLDVLNAEREYFQSSRQLVNVTIDEIITAHRILSFGGELKISEPSGAEKDIPEISRLSEAIVLPHTVQPVIPERQAHTPLRTLPESSPAPASITKRPIESAGPGKAEASGPLPGAKQGPAGQSLAANPAQPPRIRYPYSIMLASYRKLPDAKRAIAAYNAQGLDPFWVKVDLGKKGTWFRIFNGYYPDGAQARADVENYRLKGVLVKKTRYANWIGSFADEQVLVQKRIELSRLGFSAYAVADGMGKQRLYVGAFLTLKGARDQQASLENAGIQSRIVDR